MAWNTKQIPDQTGRTVLITGANSGLGYATATAMAKKNASVILACRSSKKAEEAMAQIISEVPNAKLEFLQIDLADQASIKSAAKNFRSKHSALDLLINNAGVMFLPKSQTVDGFETQLGINHLGHFTLTGLLLPTIINTPNSRIISVASLAHITGKIEFDDLMLDKNYREGKSYSQSKLANLLFARELDKRLKLAGSSTISVAAHPGGSSTNLASPRSADDKGIVKKLVNLIMPLFFQSAANGALPQLFAATAPNITGGSYFGPTKLLLEVMGPPGGAWSTPRAKNEETMRRLWEASEQLTGTRYEALEVASVATS